MFDILKVLFYALVVFGTDTYFTVGFARRCYDCVTITSCQSGLRFAENAQVLEKQLGFIPRATRQIFYNAICGADAYDAKLPKVCCSDFPRLEQISTPRTPSTPRKPSTPHTPSTPRKPTTLRTPSTPHTLRTPPKPSTPSIHFDKRMQEPSNATRDQRQIPDRDEIEMHRNLALLPNDMCGEIEGWRIVGGRVPMLYELPWMALIASNMGGGQKFHCAGSIINSRYILTAAHCFIKNSKLKTNIAGVRIGEFDLSTSLDCQGDYDTMICESNTQDIDIEEIIPHEDFTRYVEKQGDIALIRLNKSINFSDNIAPICLPVYSALRRDRLGGKNATVAGWGGTGKHFMSDKLMKVTIPILTDDVCGSYYRRFDENRLEKSFCAGKPGEDSCDGDSGGPLFKESDFGDSIRMVQFGIVSFGPKLCGRHFPGVYTDVTKYMDWILDNIRE